MSIKKRLRDFVYCYLPLPGYYGRDFKRIFAFLQESRQWTREALESYKLAQLRALLVHAERNVPYYRRLFKEHGVRSHDIRSFADYSQIPILTKDDLDENLDALKADNFDSYGPILTTTSGTTGHTTRLYRSRFQEDFRNAVVWRFLHEQGYTFRDPKVTVSSPRILRANSPYSEHNRLENDLIINTYHILDGKPEPIPDIIRKAKPKLLWAHPSILYVLAQYMIAAGIEPIAVPLIATTSEMLFPHIRRVLQTAFPGKYIEYYANRENSFAAWGYSNRLFYEASEYCHMEVELEGADGAESPAGDLISTSLHNYAVPLIRYQPGDIVRGLGYSDKTVPYPVFELIGGRGKDILESHDGLLVPYVIVHLDHVKFHKLRAYQLEQVSLDEVVMHIVPADNYDRATDEERLLSYADEALAHKFKIRINYREEIPFTRAGKRPLVISRLRK